jgi:hypothetical protein
VCDDNRVGSLPVIVHFMCISGSHLMSLRESMEAGVVLHTCNPSTQEAELRV